MFSAATAALTRGITFQPPARSSAAPVLADPVHSSVDDLAEIPSQYSLTVTR